MTDAPERIWAVVGYVGSIGHIQNTGEFMYVESNIRGVGVEYIRADQAKAATRAAAEAMRAAIIQNLTGLLGGGGLTPERAKWFDDGIATCIAEIEDLPIPG